MKKFNRKQEKNLKEKENSVNLILTMIIILFQMEHPTMQEIFRTIKKIIQGPIKMRMH